MRKRILIFASGNGTNTQNLIQYVKQDGSAEVVAVFSNNKNAFVLSRAASLDVKSVSFTKKDLQDPQGVFEQIQQLQPDLIVLAGFLLKFPEHIIAAYPKKVINIHPALLPKFGGKGMYGMHVHKAVVAQKESITGITIHYVTKEYDKGAIIFQKSVPITASDTPKDVAAKVHLLEHEWLPKITLKILTNNGR